MAMANVMEIKKDAFKSKDLYLSAFLKAKGLNLVDVKKENGRVFFYFQPKEKAEDLLKDFCNGGMINISFFTKAIQDLKTIIYN